MTAAISKWGAGLSPRGASAPPSAGPSKALGAGHQTCLHRIPFNVPLDAAKLVGVPDNPVEILLLPESLAATRQYRVSKVGGRTLNPSDKLRQRNNRCAQQVDMVGHDDMRMQGTMAVGSHVMQLFGYHCGDLFLPQVKRTAS